MKASILSCFCMLLCRSAALADTHYVDINNTTASDPFTNLVTAATNIQDAIDAASNGDSVLVSNGIYNITSEIMVNKAISVASVNGADDTVVDAGGNSQVFNLDSTNGPISIDGFTIVGGYTELDGGGIDARGTKLIEIIECIIENNEAGQNGGGISCPSINTVLSSCIIRNNRANRAGGVFRGTAKNCIISGNQVVNNGGGMMGGIARNCVISDNEALESNGGGLANCTAYNCTITGNRATMGSGMTGTGYNCIIWHNHGNETGYETVLHTSCSAEVIHGVDGNITNAPRLASSSHITLESPCQGAGDATHSSGTDIDGEAWQHFPSMGCDEPTDASAVSGGISVAIKKGSVGTATDQFLPLAGIILGPASMHVWDFGDGSYATNDLSPMYAWAASGNYPVILTAYNESYPSGISATQMISIVDAPDVPVIHVATTGDDSNDGHSWATPKTTIQAGIDSQLYEGGTVLVGPGIYAITNCIIIKRGLVVEGYEGPRNTIVDGGGVTHCFYLYDWSTLTGFSVRNGITAIRCAYNNAIVENCIIYNNQKGIYRGFIYDCVVSNNVDLGSIGAGIDDATAYNCLVVNNSARFGGGIDLVFNGPMIQSGAAYNCIVSGNTAEEVGGGILGGTAYNCLVTDNYATKYGGGIVEALAVNCTVAGNASGLLGGGVYMTGTFPAASMLLNCIVFGNAAPASPEMNMPERATNSCSPALASGIDGNITNAPLFIGAGNYHLAQNSPCINAGSTTYVSVASDLDGNPRIVDGTVDMGAYESGFEGFFITNCVPSGTEAILEWTAFPMWESTVQWSTNLTEMPFADLSGSLAYPVNSFTDTVHAAAGECFYRMEIVP